MQNRFADTEDGLKRLAIPYGSREIAALLAHLRLVDEANASFNLTAIRPEDAVGMHVLDSAIAVPYLNEAPPGDFADLGSGAGFPGVPLTILTGRPVVLVESVKKKAVFLERVVAELRLKATVRPIRAEDLALEREPGYAAVTARALSALPSLVELASPLLRPGGILICLKGRRDEEEIERGDSVAALCGMSRIGVEAVVVPSVEAARTVVTYRREGAPRVRLPRRTGMAQRQPMA